ncbi:MAG: phage gp6-like head-tail connector protein [Ruminococcus sp.]|nr:phage gp6-like head-tail connector protein [Ruminococcus sp.]
MQIITMEEAKAYLRVDSDDDDSIIMILIDTAEKICIDVARMADDEFFMLGDYVKTPVLYALAYLFEHREEADHDGLKKTLRSLMSDIRKQVF